MFRLHMLLLSIALASLASCAPAAAAGKDDASVVLDGGSLDDGGRADAGTDGADAARADAGLPPRIDAGTAVDPDGNLTCNGDDACAPNEVCGAVRTLTDGNLGIFCRAPPAAADAGPVGASCSGGLNFENEGCTTAVCDDKTTGACTRVCDDDTDCAADGLICTASAVTNVAQRICAKPCARQTDCGAGRSCRLREDTVDDANELACAGDLGTKNVGETVAQANECKTALVVEIAGKLSCTQPCVSAGDCGGAATQCRPVALPLPDRASTTAMNLCTP